MTFPHRLFAICLLLTSTGVSLADAPPRCVACRNLIPGPFYWWESPTLTAKQPVCEPCSKLETTCAICQLPIRHQGRKLEDGRWLCDRDFAAGIFRQDEALRVYEETWRDLQRLLAGLGSLPRQTITVQLVDGIQLRKFNQAMPSEHDTTTLIGLTRTRISPHRQFQHHIYLLNGLSRPRLAAVCAHEYTHAWLHENVPADRRLDHNTVEGFCELVAYKLMVERREEIEKRVILANAYTRGQLSAFVNAEAEHQFHRVVKWIKTGQDEILPGTNSARVLVLRQEPSPPLPWPPPASLPTPVPDKLMLKGISGNAARRFALLNDCTLTCNEEGRVRVGSKVLIVRCVEIRERSVVIRVRGTPGLQELFLGQEGVALPRFSARDQAVGQGDSP